MKVYVPNLQDYKCVYVKDNNTIRAYKEIPQLNSSSSYVDYYFNSNYYFTEGVQTWGNYSSYLPVCLKEEFLTDEVFYRNDYDKSLLIFLIMFIFIIYIPLKIIFRFFKRFKI